MNRSRLTVALLLVAAPVLIALPLWVCWCHTPDELDLASLPHRAPYDPAGRSLVFDPGLPFGSDIGFASQSALNFIDALREGNVYPRWSNSCNRGFGAPTFFFYPPAPYYAVAAASLVTADVTGAFRLVLSLAGLLTGLSFYFATRDLFSRHVAALGAAIYVLAPFHALDLYDRFAFASYLAYAWFPLIFLFTRRLIRGRDRVAWYGLTIAYAGLVVTHLVSAFLVLFVLVPYAVVHLTVARRWRRLLPVFGAGLVSLAIVSVYLVPLLAHRGDVHLDWVVEASYGDWRRNFAFRDEEAMGYTRAGIKPWVNRALAAQVLLAAVAGAAVWWRRRRDTEPPGHITTRRGEIALEGAIFLGLSLWTFFLQIPPSSPVWTVLPELGTVQFPWRFGNFHALTASLLLCCALSWPRETATRAAATPPRSRRVMAVAMGLAVLPALLLSARITLLRFYIFTDATAHHPVYLGKVMSEYIPLGVDGWRQFDKVQRDLPTATLSGPGEIEVVEWTTHERHLRVTTSTPTTLRLRTFDFPGWTARMDGQPVPIDSSNAAHMITVDIPPGEHELTVSLEPTGDRRAGAMVSSAAVATMLGFATVPWVRSRRRRSS